MIWNGADEVAALRSDARYQQALEQQQKERAEVKRQLRKGRNMTYDFGTKQVAAGSTDANPQGETQKFTPGSLSIYTMEGNDPFVKGRIKFASNPDSAGLSTVLSAAVTDETTGKAVKTDKPSTNMSGNNQGFFEFPNVEGHKYKVVITSTQPYACAVIWAPYKANAASQSPDR